MTRAVLFDRDGTLIVDDPPNLRPDALRLARRARSAMRMLRGAGYAIGVVTNQPGISRGDLTPSDLEAMHDRIASLLGPLDGWFVCPHLEKEGCRCRKPMPGLIVDAARQFGVTPGDCVVIGDIGSDVDAALAAGARAILVPTTVTRQAEIDAAPHVARDLAEAAQMVVRERV